MLDPQGVALGWRRPRRWRFNHIAPTGLTTLAQGNALGYLFADTPNAVAKMRELVLEWAITGKFCRSNSSDWKEGILGDVIELISGQHLMGHKQNEEGRGVPYITGPSDFGEKNPTPTRWTDQPKVTAQPGDILITVKGSGVGKTNGLVG